MSGRNGFLENIALAGDISRVQSAIKYNLRKKEFEAYFQRYLRVHAPSLTFASLTAKRQRHLIALMLHFAGKESVNNQAHRYEKMKLSIIEGLSRGRVPTVDQVLLVGLSSEEFEEAFIGDGSEAATLRQHYMQYARDREEAVKECEKLFDLSTVNHPFAKFL